MSNTYKVSCINCKKEFTVSAFGNHKGAKTCVSEAIVVAGSIRKSLLTAIPEDLRCSFCERLCKNKKGYRNHARLCSKNPERQSTVFQTDQEAVQKSRGLFKNQYSKAAVLGLAKPELSEGTLKKLSMNALSRSAEWNRKNGERIRDTVNKMIASGKWHTSLAKRMHHNYKGVDLHGKWELRYAQYLDRNEIKWERCKTSFSYEFEGKQRKYTPDFYLIETNEYVEIKGYKTPKDEAKWSQFPKSETLLVLMKKELKNLGIELRYDK
jgi:hypothetical protein